MRLASFIASAAGRILVLLCSISDVAAQSRERSGWYVGGGIGSNWASDIGIALLGEGHKRWR